ncbi:hypothetical protein BDQ17DRAFT_1392200 [Cyathus striatus]|nr:hypothetical protein BDQ17DRAFT_1392200 [Cyathus striatus]
MESSTSGRVQLPPVFENVSIDHLVHLIADMLNRLMDHNDQIPLSPESLTRFHSRSAPSISVLDYLERIVKFTNVEKSCLLLTLHYIDQICARMPLFTLSSLTCLCDAFCTNQLYAKVGGISVTELNLLEREFLSAIDWRLMCTREVLQEYYVNLVRTHSSGQYTLFGADSPTASSESDMEVDSGQSRPPSPEVSIRSQGGQRATIEQNMAFAALQESRQHKNVARRADTNS